MVQVVKQIRKTLRFLGMLETLDAVFLLCQKMSRMNLFKSRKCGKQNNTTGQCYFKLYKHELTDIMFIYNSLIQVKKTAVTLTQSE